MHTITRRVLSIQHTRTVSATKIILALPAAAGIMRQMLATTDAATLFLGNNSTVTPYAVVWPSLDPAHVKVRIIAPGSGTVAVAAGVATFSTAQTLEIGGLVRIATVTYTVATRISSTVYTFTLRPTISATTFWLMDVFTELNPADYTYTVDGDGVLNGIITNAAVPVTSLVLIYRRTPLLQDVALPLAGSLPAATLERMADRQVMTEQETRALIDGTVSGGSGGGQPLNANLTGLAGIVYTQNSFPARTASGTGAPDTPITVGSDFSLSGNVLSLSSVPGDVFGPASSAANAIPFFSGTGGKTLKAALATNDASGGGVIDLGTDTDTTPRVLTITKIWNNAGLTGGCLLVAVTDTNSAAGSWLQQWTAGGANRGKVHKTGQFRLLDGSAVAPIFSFEAQTGTGMYRDTAGGAIAFSVAGVTKFASSATVLQAFVEFLVTIGAVDILNVTAAFVKSAVNIMPAVDNTSDLGSDALRWKSLFLSGPLSVYWIVHPFSGLSLASAGTIAPTRPVMRVTGTAVINTITPPAEIAGDTGRITLLPDGIFTWTTAGNIALAGTAVVGKALDFTWDATIAKWHPHYTS